jgi:hypothetical protein
LPVNPATYPLATVSGGAEESSSGITGSKEKESQRDRPGRLHAMTGTRYELPWGDIACDVRNAINKEVPDLKYINVHRLTDHIIENSNEYPLLGNLPPKTIRCRCTHVMRHTFKWETYSKGNGRGTVFVKPE